MHSRLLAVVVPALAVLTLACRAPVLPEMRHVVAFTPHDERVQPGKLQVVFDRPAVATSDVGTTLVQAPVSLDPPAELTATWVDRQTLVVEVAPLQPATRYALRLLGDLAATTKEREFWFVEAPLEVTRLTAHRSDGTMLDLSFSDQPWYQRQNAPVPPNGFEFRLSLSAPVHTRDAASHCRMEGNTGMRPLTAIDDEVSREVRLRVPALGSGTGRWQLVCRDLAPAHGNTPMRRHFRAEVATPELFTLSDIQPVNREVPPDDLKLLLQFTNEVDGAALAARVRLEPPVPSLPRRWRDDWVQQGHAYAAVVQLKPHTSYKLVLERGLSDQFGQVLPGDVTQTFSFTTGAARPGMRFPEGDWTIERGGRDEPLWTRNVHQIDVGCLPVKPEQLFAVQYAMYQGYGEPPPTTRLSEMPWQYKTIEIEDKPDAWVATHLDLRALCGIDKHGFALVDVESREVMAAFPNERGHAWSRLVGNWTDLGVVVKVGAGAGVVWVVGLQDNLPVADADVRVFSRKGALVFRGRTDARGLLTLPSATVLAAAAPELAARLRAQSDQEEPYYGATPQLSDFRVVVQKADDWALVEGAWTGGIETWQFDGVSHDWSGKKERGFLFTDRGTYRPGDTVHVKGVLREAGAKGLQMPSTKSVHVRLRDGRWNDIWTDTLPINDFGSFNFDLPVSTDAPLGSYTVEARVGNTSFQVDFLVEEYRVRSLEATVTAGSSQMAGKPIEFQIHGRYLFGTPASKGKASWASFRRPVNFNSKKFADFQFAAPQPEDPDMGDSGEIEARSELGSGAVVLDHNGAARVQVVPTEEDGPGPQEYSLATELRDITGEVASSSATVLVHRATAYVGLQTPSLAAAGAPMAVRAVAVDLADAPTVATGTLTLHEYGWNCQEAYLGLRLSRECKRDRKVVQEVPVRFEGGVTEVRVVPPRPGSYALTLTGRDGQGRRSATETYVWVHGPGEVAWDPEDGIRVGMYAEKKTWRPGETARILPQLRLQQGLGLWTYEQSGVLHSDVAPLTASAQPREVKIVPEFAPNVFASLVAVKARDGEGDKHRPQLQMGIAPLLVDTVDRKLDVKVEVAQQNYAPGDEVQATVTVTSHGKPVEAEVALAASDEGVLLLTGYQTPDLMAALYQPWDLGVDTATNWTRVHRPMNPEDDDIDEGGDSGLPTAVRKRFLASAFWAASLRTNAKGQVSARFKAPDNLTAFRVMAISADRAARFGSGDERFTVQKPLMAVPALPRVLTPGDKLDIATTVHNHTTEPGEVIVRLKATGVDAPELERKVQVAAGGKALVAFPATALFVPQAHFEFSASMGRHSDRVAVDLPVVRRLAREVATVRGQKTTQADVPIQWQTGIEVADSLLEVHVDPTGMAALEPALKELVHYPYGCLEQTLSTFIPLAKVKELGDLTGLEGLKGPKLDAYIAAAVTKLPRFQSHNGLFSLWEGGQGSARETVYALEGMLEAQRAGIAIPERVREAALRALGTWALAQSQVAGNLDRTTLAVAAYVMAAMAQPDSVLNARLFESRTALSVFAQTYLLRALWLSKAPPAEVDALLAALYARTVVEGDTAQVKELADHLWWPSAQQVQSTAAGLTALLLVRPNDPLIPKLAAGLMAAQEQDGTWSNTHDNAQAVSALALFARQQAAGKANVKVTLNGKTLAGQTLTGHEALHLSVPVSTLAGGKAPTEPGVVRVTSDVPVRFLVRTTQARREDAPAPADHGFQLRREYLDPATGKPLQTLKIGDLVRVRVTVTNLTDQRDVVVVDPLPAGWDAIKIVSHDFDFYELRDQEVRGFVNSLSSGAHTMVYLARAMVSGTYHVQGATAEAMYLPEVRGRGEVATVVVQ
jgi:uncharacterized protein YfaS (alpha-2-macroglobulin family)